MAITERVTSLSAGAAGADRFGFPAECLTAKVQSVLAPPAPADWRPTGIDRGFYLDMVERIVRTAADWVDADGRVIDPVKTFETGQASPRFAAPGAILLHFGRAPELRETVFRSMTHCCQALPSGAARGQSPDFWMRELATAYMALETVAAPEQLAGWGAGLAAVEPEAIYTQVRPDGTGLDKLHNWPVYAAAGEAMREAAGLKPDGEFLWGNAFFDRYVGAQFGHFTGNGMYRDPGDPITYDITTRLQVACGLVFGYNGQHRAALDELLRRGGLATLLFVSPEGFSPYGGRSSAFHFREAIVAALCELEARRYAVDDLRLAGAFKRQARLSALSVRRWLLDMEPWRYIKNGFDPGARHGCDVYGDYSTYGLLAASFLGLAAIFSDDTIAEAPAPAECGGFALALAPAFHKVFANCAGSYVQIDTAADEHYDATGLGRFAIRGAPLELGLGMPFSAAAGAAMAPGCVAPVQPVAIGPLWQEDGQWVSLAGLSQGLTSCVHVEEETPDAVQIEVVYTHGQSLITETYRLASQTLAINCRVSLAGSPASSLRFRVPLLVTDGDARSVIHGPTDGAVRVVYRGWVHTIAFAPELKAVIEPFEYANRNGVYRSLVLETSVAVIKVSLALSRT